MMKIAKILIVEDDLLAAELISDFLRTCNFEVEAVFSVTDGLSSLNTQSYDLLLLDLNLPDFTGFEILKTIKNRLLLPIIVMSAHSDTRSKVAAFKYGASDYMVKPLDLEELEARIWVQLGRNSEIPMRQERDRFEIRGSSIYFEGEAIDLTVTEFDILSQLIEQKNRAVRREVLIDTLSSVSSPRSLDNHIKNIRKKLDQSGSSAAAIRTEYGVGYKLLM
jgi:DNA-binding response OmpR family regulator